MPLKRIKPKLRIVDIIILGIGVLPFVYWIVTNVNSNLWYDEVYSLKHFVLNGLRSTLFTYPVPNNHVLFNISSLVISKLLGIRTLVSVTENIYFLRIFQVVIVFFITCYSMLIPYKHFSIKRPFLILIILFSTIPFLNFSMQLRGYNLTALFLIMVLYHLMGYLKNGGILNKTLIIVLSFAIFYTIPSNLYFLLSVIAFLVFSLLNEAITKTVGRKKIFISIFLILIGVGIAFIFYLPILHQILNNPFSARKPDNIFHSLNLIPEVLEAFLSNRYVLIFPLVLGILYSIKAKKRIENYLTLLLISVLILPFIFSFFHQKVPFQRVFSPLAPVFSLLLLIFITKFFDRFSGLKNNLFTLSMSAYLLLGCAYEITSNNNKVYNKLKNEGVLVQNIYQNYYLSDMYQPEKKIEKLKHVLTGKRIILFNQFDIPSVGLYLEKEKIAFTEIRELDSLQLKNGEGNKTIILTSLLDATKQKLNKEKLQYQVLNEDFSFLNLIEVH